MELDTNFKERLRWALQTHEPPYNQVSLSKELTLAGMKTSSQAVGYWVNGLTQPTKARLIKIAELCKCRFEWLAYGRGPMKMTDKGTDEDRSTTPREVTEAAAMAQDWEQRLIELLPEELSEHWAQRIKHPGGSGTMAVDFLTNGLCVDLGLYRSPAALISAARQRLWQLLVIRNALPPIQGRRFVLLLSPLESWREVPSRHIDAITAEARPMGIDVIHVSGVEDAASFLAGRESRPNLPQEDELGLDSSVIL